MLFSGFSNVNFHFVSAQYNDLSLIISSNLFIKDHTIVSCF